MSKYKQAILSVMEIHSPIKYKRFVECRRCITLYPCETIKAIAQHGVMVETKWDRILQQEKGKQ